MSQNLSIAYLNQHLLEHPSLLPALMDIDPRLPELIYGRNDFVGGHISSWYNRIGQDTMFCRNPNQIEQNKLVTNYSVPTTETFEQVTDQRCIDLHRTHWHKPWVVMWSGGIDSTLMLTSILRNIPPGDFKNIQVWCNSASVYENPKFFMDHIQPNFEVVSDMETMSMARDVFMIAGESGYILNIEKHKNFAYKTGFDDQGRDLMWANNRDKLVAFCDTIHWPSPSKTNFSNWLYNSLEQNIRSTGLPIHTVSEWWYWFLFNYHCASNIMQHLDHQCVQATHSAFLENFVAWFNNDLYQRWGLHNLNEIVRMKNKNIAKKYIHSVFKDEIHLNFKTKVASSGRPHSRVWFTTDNLEHIRNRPRNWKNDFVYDDRVFCVLNNKDCLYLDRDLDQIIKLLPEHINLDSLNYL